MSDQLQVAIVGGGIGGLTAAHALRMRGLNVTVLEQANEPREVGAGISIQPNAVRLLERIGLIDRIKAIGTPAAGWLMRTSIGEPIDISALPASSVQSFNVHRAEFLRVLADLQPQGHAPARSSPVSSAGNKRLRAIDLRERCDS